MNPVLKRTLTGLAVGAVVICVALFAPPMAITSVAVCLILLSAIEFAFLMRKKKPSIWSWEVLDALGFIFGVGLIVNGLWALVKIPAMYGDATCGGLRLGNEMLLYVIDIVINHVRIHRIHQLPVAYIRHKIWLHYGEFHLI